MRTDHKIRFAVNPGTPGGMSNFFKRLEAVLVRRGLYSERDYGVLLIAPSTAVDLAVLRRAKSEGRKIIVRLDGCSYLDCTVAELFNLVLKRYGYSLGGSFFPEVLERLHANTIKARLSRFVNCYRNRIIKKCLKEADGIVFQSCFSRSMINHYVAPCDGRVILNGVDLAAFTAEGPCVSIPCKRRWNLVVAHSFRPHKRLLDVARVFEAWCKIDPDSTLHVIGDDDGICLRLLREWLSGRRQLDVRIHGYVPTARLPEWYRACDAMLALSFGDPCPNVVVEAVACGLPVMCTSHSGAAEIVSIEDLIVPEKRDWKLYELYVVDRIPPVDIRACVDRLRVVLSSRDLREKVRSRRGELDIERVADQYVAYAEEICAFG